MRNKILNYVVVSVLCLLCVDCTEKEEKFVEPGSIYGVITDKVTGEPVNSAGVSLSPTGAKTVTGMGGQYEFLDLEPENYKINVTKTGYADLVNYDIQVKEGESNRGDLQMEKLPPSLRITNSTGDDIDSLHFGSSRGVETINFNVFNDGVNVLTWDIVEVSDWIVSVSKTEGTLQPGRTQGIIITIDRDLLEGVNNMTKLYVNSDDGNKELTVTATGIDKILPTLNTLAATDVTTRSATFHGEMITNGVPTYTERGFVYSQSSMPTLENTIARVTSSITSDSLYDAVISSDLSLGQQYYVRAYAINLAGVAYSSNEISFITVQTLPKLSTQEISNINITNNRVTFNGTILSTGDPAYTERGFVYSKMRNPTVDEIKKVANGRDVGSFSSNVTDLEVGSTYYVRAYAENELGTAYGEEVVCDFFATLPTLTTQTSTNVNIAAGTAVLNGTILTVGDPEYTERGFVYGITHNPTVEVDTTRVALGNGKGIFSANVTGLQMGNLYYVRSYATNIGGTAYGEEIELDLNAVMPTLTTQTSTNVNIAAGTAVFNGTILTVGDPVYTERGFVCGTTHNPTVEISTKFSDSGSGTGAFSVNATGLQMGNLYYVRSYATNAAGTVYGEEVELDLNAVMPTLTTQVATDVKIAAGTAVFNGTILTVGDPAYTERGFVYGTMNNPTIENTINKYVVSGNGTGKFNVTAEGLQMGSVYYVRAYATNVAGTEYGEDVMLDFNAVMPQVSTQAVTDIRGKSAVFNGTIESVGDPAYTEKGFVYGNSHNPTIENANKKIAPGTSSGSYSANISGLTTGGLYYVRAYVTNVAGTVYGGEVSFTPNYQNSVIIVIQAAKKIMVQKNDENTTDGMSWNSADGRCKDLTSDDFNDWRLPTKDELAVLYIERNIIGNFVTSSNNNPWYWSSTANYDTNHWVQSFSSGVQNVNYDGSTNRCRCVRTVLSTD